MGPSNFPVAHRIIGDPAVRLRFEPGISEENVFSLRPDLRPLQPDLFSQLVPPVSNDSTEREATYLVKRSALERLVDLSTAQRVEIFQAYFPKKLVERLALEVFSRHTGEVVYPLETFSSARIRRVIDGESVSYTLEIKGPKTGGWRAKIARAEMSAAIDRSRFYELMPQASRGFIDKTRFVVTGHVWSKTTRSTEVSAHIDFIHGTGQVVKDNQIWRWQPNRADFSKVDIELPSEKLLRALRKGNHDFDFLKAEAVEISALRRSDREALSTQRMARNGVDRKARKVIARLIAA